MFEVNAMVEVRANKGQVVFSSECFEKAWAWATKFSKENLKKTVVVHVPHDKYKYVFLNGMVCEVPD